MRISTKLLIILFSLGAFINAHAANEWKNPDLEEPLKKKEAPRPAPAPLAKPTPAPGPMPEGQVGLQVLRVCDYQLSYVDKGSGGKIDGSFYLPNTPAGFYMIGAYAQGNYHDPSDCILAVKPANQQSMSLLQSPIGWERRWTDKGSGAGMDGSIWHPTSGSPDYVCLGSIAHKGYKQPLINNYACVHRCLVENSPAASPVWSTRGTGAKHKVYIYKLHNSNSFYAVNNPDAMPALQDIKGEPGCTF